MSGSYISKIPVLVVALVIGIVLVTSAVVPLASDYSEAKTFTNEGYFRMSEVTSSDQDTIITWDYTKPYIFNINGTDFTIPAGTTGGNDAYPYTIIAQDGWAVRVAISAGDKVDLNLYGSGTSANLLWYATVNDNDTATITLSNGTASFVKNTASPVTQSYTKVFIPDDNGDYVLKKKNVPAYLNSDSLIYATGRTSTAFGSNTFAINCNLTGNIEDGETVTVLAPTGFTVSNISIDSAEVNGYNDLYLFNNVSFDITQTSTSITAGAVYSQVIIPHEVTADPDNPAAYKNLVKVVPLMAFIMLVVAAAGMVYFKNRD